MSYFMIAVGPRPDFASLADVEAVPVVDAQDYVQRLARMLAIDAPQSDVWFVHDGETGTSHNFVMTSEERVQMENVPVSATVLAEIILACQQAGDSFFIWWAGGELDVVTCTSIQGVMDTITRQMNEGDDILIKYEHNEANK